VAARNYRESRTRGRSLAAVARSVSTKRRGDAMKNKVFYGRTRAYFHPLEESAGEKGIPFARANDRQPANSSGLRPSEDSPRESLEIRCAEPSVRIAAELDDDLSSSSSSFAPETRNLSCAQVAIDNETSLSRIFKIARSSVGTHHGAMLHSR